MGSPNASKELDHAAGTGIDILNGSLSSGIVRFAMPVALTGILEQLSNMIDTVMVGHLMGVAGTQAQAAVGANAPVTGFLVALFVGTSLGANVTIANAIGQRDYEAASKAVHTASSCRLEPCLWLRSVKPSRDSCSLRSTFLQRSLKSHCSFSGFTCSACR